MGTGNWPLLTVSVGRGRGCLRAAEGKCLQFADHARHQQRTSGPRRELRLYKFSYIIEDGYLGESSWVQAKGHAWVPESGGCDVQ